jgi:hypothetical protein
MKLQTIKLLLIIFILFSISCSSDKKTKFEGDLFVGEWKFKSRTQGRYDFKHPYTIEKDTIENQYISTRFKGDIILGKPSELIKIKIWHAKGDTLFGNDYTYYLIHKKKDTINVVIQGKLMKSEYYYRNYEK